MTAGLGPLDFAAADVVDIAPEASLPPKNCPSAAAATMRRDMASGQMRELKKAASNRAAHVLRN
jgi:hypothetical protein